VLQPGTNSTGQALCTTLGGGMNTFVNASGNCSASVNQCRATGYQANCTSCTSNGCGFCVLGGTPLCISVGGSVGLCQYGQSSQSPSGCTFGPSLCVAFATQTPCQGSGSCGWCQFPTGSPSTGICMNGTAAALGQQICTSFGFNGVWNGPLSTTAAAPVTTASAMATTHSGSGSATTATSSASEIAASLFTFFVSLLFFF